MFSKRGTRITVDALTRGKSEPERVANSGTGILQIASGVLSAIADSLRKIDPAEKDHPK